ncbi:uroporphyrinogen-III C-methyltransferase [Alteromonas sp. ASW11-19]|uniref:Uroporphyrinogen-III C-methyltransferase n=1 Tax=Alteromonas salexigens TaxID=2982530 RepID=A0ABT2VPE7_9ALTE|nr:uroporphyrinogen-III C-methyltransferase [Alteromonas salexigens]MCU7554768.1 uroporphyrinogen-III C-methyltransferase [Alteromonas salexigens]
MSNHNDKDKPEEALPPATVSDEPPASEHVEPAPTETDTESETDNQPEPPKKAKTGALWFMVIVCLLLIFALAGGAYWYETQRTDNSQALADAQRTQSDQVNELQSTLSTLRSELAALKNERQTLRGELDNLASSDQEIIQQSKSVQQQTESLQQQIENLEGRRPADWLIAEADYLVRMAGRKLWLEQDVRTAIMLLVNADKRLKSLADPSVLPVRAKLAEDIQALQQLNPISHTSVALALSGMLGQVKALPLDTFEKPAGTGDTSGSEVSDSPDDWLANLKAVWRSLVNDFLSVKELDGPVEPVMSQETRWLIKEQLRFQLMNAQSAALNANQPLYNQSLQNALAILKEKFSMDDAKVSGFITALNNLIETDVSREIPTKLAAQQPLENLLEQRVKQVFGQGASAL